MERDLLVLSDCVFCLEMLLFCHAGPLLDTLEAGLCFGTFFFKPGELTNSPTFFCFCLIVSGNSLVIWGNLLWTHTHTPAVSRSWEAGMSDGGCVCWSSCWNLHFTGLCLQHSFTSELLRRSPRLANEGEINRTLPDGPGGGGEHKEQGSVHDDGWLSGLIFIAFTLPCFPNWSVEVSLWSLSVYPQLVMRVPDSLVASTLKTVSFLSAWELKNRLVSELL